MNWRRGIFRSWIVASVLWLVSATAVVFYNDEHLRILRFVGLTDYSLMADVFRDHLTIVLLPPLLLGLVILAICWAVSGFHWDRKVRR